MQVSEATARRCAYRMGAALVGVQSAQACSPAPEVRAAIRQRKHIVSPDGAMVSLVKGQWAEVKTVVVGCVEAGEPEKPVHSTQLSYFSRMLDASAFCEQASAELLRRGIDQVEQVCAVMDGAKWIDSFLDWQRADALRILDFAHAAEDVSAIVQLPEDWLSRQLHELKHNGPATVLHELRVLRDKHREVEEISKKLAYLEKREARMQYPEYQALGWSIGSGIVESGNKVVMQARLKGAGMHWSPTHVNPMLALRTSACNDRWNEACQQAQTHLSGQRFTRRDERQRHREDQLLRSLQICILLWRNPLSKPEPPAVVSPVPKTSRSSRPSPTHPWRRQFLAKK